MIRITETLKLAIPLYDGSDQIYAWVHSAPISREVFEANFLLLSKTYAAVIGSGLGEVAGPAVAAMTLRAVAKTLVAKDGDADALTLPLLNEIRRLSNVLAPTPQGWETIPLHDALAANRLDPEDIGEVENAIVFFTLCSAIMPRRMRPEFLNGAAMLWGAQITSLNATAFGACLQTSTAGASSGVKSTAPELAQSTAPVSAIPSRAIVQIEGQAVSSLPV